MTLSAEETNRNNDIRVSVIIPVYNAANTLVRSLDSVLAQTYPAFEIIVVDNGSTDNSMSIIRQYMDRFPHLIKVAESTIRGANHARNTGLAMATGQWVAFLDADDELMPEKLQHQVALILRNPSVLWVRGGTLTHVINAQGQQYSYSNPIDQDLEAGLFRNSLGQTCSNLWRRDILNKVGGWDINIHVLQDPFLGMKLLEHGYLPIADTQILSIAHKDYRLTSVSRGQDWDHVKNLILTHFQLLDRKLDYLKKKDADIPTYKTIAKSERERLWAYYLIDHGPMHKKWFSKIKKEHDLSPALKTLLKSAYRYIAANSHRPGSIMSLFKALALFFRLLILSRSL